MEKDEITKGCMELRKGCTMGGIIEMQLKLPFSVQKKDKWFLAGCDQMDIFSQGETEAVALENLKEALKLFMVSCLQRNTLNQVLEECGFRA
ncbi:MAG: hypothetical protein JEZ02_03925 [Desulfatibacillum sp.]|nr:hypothetical protein [Desulfatibacillum sp.]